MRRVYKNNYMGIKENAVYKESNMDFTEIITRNDFHKTIDHYDFRVGVEIGVGRLKPINLGTTLNHELV